MSGSALTAPLVHVLLVVAALAAYVLLTVSGNDGNPVFVFVGGQLTGAAIQATTGRPPQV